MLDKVQLIKQEIERLIDIEEETHYLDKVSFNSGRWKALTQVKTFIDSLPEESGCEVNFTTKSEDLEEEIDRFEDWINNFNQSDYPTSYTVRDIARHFAEWQKHHMMKDAVEATIFSELKDSDGSLFQAKSDRFRMNGVKISDRIKVIPIKPEQQ